MYACMHVCTHSPRIFARIYIHMRPMHAHEQNAHTHTHTHTHIYIYTHTHTHRMRPYSVPPLRMNEAHGLHKPHGPIAPGSNGMDTPQNGHNNGHRGQNDHYHDSSEEVVALKLKVHARICVVRVSWFVITARIPWFKYTRTCM